MHSDRINVDVRVSETIDGVAWRPSLRWNVAVTLLGNITFAAGQLGIFVILARIGTREMAGQYAWALSIATPIMVFANCQLRIIQATDSESRTDFRDYLGFRLVTSLAALAAIGCLVVALGLESRIAVLVCVVGVAKFIEALSDVQCGMLQQRERMDLLARSAICRGVFGCLAFAIGVYLTADVICAAAGLAVAWLVVLIAHDVPTTGKVLLRPWRKLCLPRLDMSTLLSIGWTTLPAGILAALCSLEMNIPRYGLQIDAGAEALGLFVSVAYLGFVGQRVMQAASQSALPRLSRHLLRGQLDAFRRLCLKLAILGLITGAAGVTGAAIFGNQLIALVYSSEYSQRSGFLIFLMIAVAIQLVAQPLVVAVYAMRRYWWLIALHTSIAVFMAGACCWLIPRFGIDGAAYACVASALLSAAGYFLLVVVLLWQASSQPPWHSDSGVAQRA